MQNEELNAIVAQKIEISPEVIILRVVADGWELSDFIPGQFTILGVPGSYGRIELSDEEQTPPDPNKLIKKPYSVASSSKSKEYVEFHIALVRSGVMTPRIFNLKVGDKIWLSNQFRGIFTLQDVPKESHLILIATGTGLSPYMSMIRTIITADMNRKMTVIQGARHSWDLGYSSELFTLTKICKEFNYIPIISLTENEPYKWKGETGFIHDYWNANKIEKLWGFKPNPSNTHIFLCGHPMMLQAMLEILGLEGFKEHTPKEPGQVHLERFFSNK
ncbi:MAG: hypothetical protein ACD_79C01098G0002 [uncultured bacterium]|nr:MAG: hypothetical protein ACD_79C01098G0002 [uncultured bacterium]